MRAETKIIEGVNGSRTRSIYYGIAVSSLGCITPMLVQVWSPPRWEEMTSWEGKDLIVSTCLLAALFLFYAILVIRSLCVPIPIITYRMGEPAWTYVTFYIMVFMFFFSRKVHSMIVCIYVIGTLSGGVAVKQLNWPVRDVYIQHIVFTDLLCCVSCYMGYQPHEEQDFYILIGLATLSIVVNHILNKAVPTLH